MSPRTVAAIGVLAALAYVGSLMLMAIPNATLSILIVFYAGYCIGAFSGAITGLISALLISIFNPYGMAVPPLLAAQMLGYSLIGFCGGLSRKWLSLKIGVVTLAILGTLGIATALLYQIPVSIVDAWLFGPFQERLLTSVPFMLITVVSNVLFFVLLFPMLAKLQKVPIFRST